MGALLSTEPEKAKAFWRSKRFWVSVLTAVAPLVPPVQAFASASPETYSALLAMLFGYVGVATKGPVALKDA